jgi:hypothetical protein
MAWTNLVTLAQKILIQENLMIRTSAPTTAKPPVE